jgi:uncharacterized protein YbjT (DUF2867 family)
MTHLVLVVGAAGWLGEQIVDALRARHGDVRVMLRGGEAHAKAAALQAKGAAIVAGDLADPESLLLATRGVHTIISAVQGGPDVIIDGQTALARAGLANGAARILPSDFSVDLAALTPERHLFLGWRAEADRQIAGIGLPQINVLNGAFTEMLLQPFFGLLNAEAGEVAYWGAADQPYDFTTTADVAAAVAQIALDPDYPAGPAHIAGDTKSPREIAEIAARVYGKPFALTHNGPLAELDAEIATRQATSPHDPMPWAGLQYHRVMATGEGKLNPSQTRVAPPHGWTGIEAFLRAAHG